MKVFCNALACELVPRIEWSCIKPAFFAQNLKCDFKKPVNVLKTFSGKTGGTYRNLFSILLQISTG